MTVDKRSETSGELEFAALHADDLLLDALGARCAVGAPDDVVAGLLAAYVSEIDARPGPLTALLVAEADDYLLSVPEPALHRAAPPVLEELAEPVALVDRRRRPKFGVAHRAAAVATVGALVLGLGGVSAAVTGQGGPLQGIRHVYNSVTDQVAPQHSAEDKISRTLTDAQTALAANDLRGARDLLEQARTDIESQADGPEYSSLRANLIELRDRWHQAFTKDFGDEPSAPATATTPKSAHKLGSVPGGAVLPSDSSPSTIVGKSDPTDQLAGTGSGVKQTKDQIADHAEQKLDPLPDLPVGELRAPTWAPILGGK
jgi:hypothetical protein